MRLLKGLISWRRKSMLCKKKEVGACRNWVNGECIKGFIVENSQQVGLMCFRPFVNEDFIFNEEVESGN
jgi:hypothetical protein